MQGNFEKVDGIGPQLGSDDGYRLKYTQDGTIEVFVLFEARRKIWSIAGGAELELSRKQGYE
jgi:hypothetical protein